MQTTVKEAVRQTSNVLNRLLDLESQTQLIDFKFVNGKLGYTFKGHSPDPVFDSIKVDLLNLKVGDLVFFDYRDQSSGSDRVRRGYVEDVSPDSVLIFDLEAVDHQTGNVGALRRSTKKGITNLYRLTDFVPF